MEEIQSKFSSLRAHVLNSVWFQFLPFWGDHSGRMHFDCENEEHVENKICLVVLFENVIKFILRYIVNFRCCFVLVPRTFLPVCLYMSYRCYSLVISRGIVGYMNI